MRCQPLLHPIQVSDKTFADRKNFQPHIAVQSERQIVKILLVGASGSKWHTLSTNDTACFKVMERMG